MIVYPAKIFDINFGRPKRQRQMLVDQTKPKRKTEPTEIENESFSTEPAKILPSSAVLTKQSREPSKTTTYTRSSWFTAYHFKFPAGTLVYVADMCMEPIGGWIVQWTHWCMAEVYKYIELIGGWNDFSILHISSKFHSLLFCGIVYTCTCMQKKGTSFVHFRCLEL